VATIKLGGGAGNTQCDPVSKRIYVTERKANPFDPRRFIRKSCHSRPNIGPMAQRKKMACKLSLASH